MNNFEKNNKYHLMVDEKCKLCSTIQGCLDYLLDNYKMTTKYYGHTITKKDVWEWVEWHSGLYTFVDDPYVNKKYLDVCIVENGYEWGAIEYLKEIAEYDIENNIEYTGYIKEEEEILELETKEVEE